MPSPDFMSWYCRSTDEAAKLSREAREATELPKPVETIILELPKPVLLVKYSFSKDYATLELWIIPAGEEFERLLDASVASRLLLTFEGDFAEARQECRTYIDQNYPHRPELWVPKELVVEAVEKD